MISTWIQSTEEYKGFTLEIVMTRNSTDKFPHRHCLILDKDGMALGMAKTKKELKDLIDNGIYNAE